MILYYWTYRLAHRLEKAISEERDQYAFPDATFLQVAEAQR
jgi:hypothetical protein